MRSCGSRAISSARSRLLAAEYWPPQVAREGTKKTVFTNFADLCRAMNRPTEHVQAFLLAELGTRGAIRTLDALAPDLTSSSWRAINKKFLRRELADHWHDWRDDVQRWAAAGDPNRALAAFDALLRAPAPETGAIAWFVSSADTDIRATCRSRLGLEV